METVTERKNYTARCERDDDWWIIDIPELEGAFTQARRLDQVEEMARDLIALMLEVPENSFDIVVEPHLAEDLEAMVAETRQLRKTAERAAQATDRVAASLLARGFTTRDVGRLLGISYQRVAQLARKHHAA